MNYKVMLLTLILTLLTSVAFSSELTRGQIFKLIDSGVEPEVIVLMIEKDGIDFELTSEDVISLNGKIDKRILKAMLENRKRTPRPVELGSQLVCTFDRIKVWYSGDKRGYRFHATIEVFTDKVVLRGGRSGDLLQGLRKMPTKTFPYSTPKLEWHYLYSPGSRFTREASIGLASDDFGSICFSPKQVDLALTRMDSFLQHNDFKNHTDVAFENFSEIQQFVSRLNGFIRNYHLLHGIKSKHTSKDYSQPLCRTTGKVGGEYNSCIYLSRN